MVHQGDILKVETPFIYSEYAKNLPLPACILWYLQDLPLAAPYERMAIKKACTNSVQTFQLFYFRLTKFRNC